MTVHLLVSGKVQGVFYRKSAKMEADQLGLVGWIKNRDDGTVEANIGGKEDRLKEFVDWCKKGPPLSKVIYVEETWSDSAGDWKEFEIVS